MAEVDPLGKRLAEYALEGATPPIVQPDTLFRYVNKELSSTEDQNIEAIVGGIHLLGDLKVNKAKELLQFALKHKERAVRDAAESALLNLTLTKGSISTRAPMASSRRVAPRSKSVSSVIRTQSQVNTPTIFYWFIALQVLFFFLGAVEIKVGWNYFPGLGVLEIWLGIFSVYACLKLLTALDHPVWQVVFLLLPGANVVFLMYLIVKSVKYFKDNGYDVILIFPKEKEKKAKGVY